jgi:hypothetical protein
MPGFSDNLFLHWGTLDECLLHVLKDETEMKSVTKTTTNFYCKVFLHLNLLWFAHSLNSLSSVKGLWIKQEVVYTSFLSFDLFFSEFAFQERSCSDILVCVLNTCSNMHFSRTLRFDLQLLQACFPTFVLQHEQLHGRKTASVWTSLHHLPDLLSTDKLFPETQ